MKKIYVLLLVMVVGFMAVPLDSMGQTQSIPIGSLNIADTTTQVDSIFQKMETQVKKLLPTEFTTYNNTGNVRIIFHWLKSGYIFENETFRETKFFNHMYKIEVHIPKEDTTSIIYYKDDTGPHQSDTSDSFQSFNIKGMLSALYILNTENNTIEHISVEN